MENEIETRYLERQTFRSEWLTFLLICCCTASYATVTFFATATNYISLLLLPIIVTFHSSLQHEALHGHPFKNPLLNELMIFMPIGLFVPYRRFRDTHIAHHNDEILTDPYDDPETNYLDPKVWVTLSAPMQKFLRFNNTLFGRMLVGPAIGMFWFYRGDLCKHQAGEKNITSAYVLHFIGLVPVILWVMYCDIPFLLYILCAYLGLSLLRIRTFLEHRAHEAAKGRSVVIEDRGFFAFLFLNNNFHIVHHDFPGVPWHAMPKLYACRKQDVLARNRNYVYASYGEIFRKYMFKAKDDVPHPLRPSR